MRVMGVMVILLSVSLIVALCFLVAFIWSVKTGQFEDDYSPAHQVLFEDQPLSESLDTNDKTEQQNQ